MHTRLFTINNHFQPFLRKISYSIPTASGSFLTIYHNNFARYVITYFLSTFFSHLSKKKMFSTSSHRNDLSIDKRVNLLRITAPLISALNSSVSACIRGGGKLVDNTLETSVLIRGRNENVLPCQKSVLQFSLQSQRVSYIMPLLSRSERPILASCNATFLRVLARVFSERNVE